MRSDALVAGALRFVSVTKPNGESRTALTWKNTSPHNGKRTRDSVEGDRD